MENLRIKLNDDDFYDKIISDSLPEGGNAVIVTKDHATIGEKAGALITFTVELPDGTLATAQATVTIKLLLLALETLKGRYTDDGSLRPPPTPNYG